MRKDSESLIELLKQIDRFVDDLETSLDTRIDVRNDCDGILFCGMGGSAISGDIVADLCSDISSIPMSVLRYPALPKWVSDKTFVVIGSYSGNTRETKHMYEEAAKLGCNIALICSGGEMEKMALERGDLLIRVPPGLQPRQSVGFMIGYITRIVDSLAGIDLAGIIRDSIPNLRKYNDLLRSDGYYNQARRIAEVVDGNIPVICIDQSVSSIAFRWRSQLSENSKTTAFSWTIPEFNHNEIVGWIEFPRDEILPLMLVSNVQLPTMNDITESTNVTLENNGVPFYQINVMGRNKVECALKAIILGDYVSYYLAKLKGVDPIEVKPIVSLKKEMKAVTEANEGLKIIQVHNSAP